MQFNSLAKDEQKEIKEVLTIFGLKEKELIVYLDVLRFNEITITPLSKSVKMPITTVQSILNRLVDTGVIQVTTKKSRHVYTAYEPSTLKKILERKARDVSSILPLLKKLKGDEHPQSKVKIYYRERMADIFHEALKAKNKLVYEIVSADDFQLILGEKFHFTRRRLENNVRLKSLRVEAHEIKKYNKKIHERELREAKFLPRELTFKSSIMFWDKTVAVFSSHNDGLAITMESHSIFEMHEPLFNLLWEVSRKMETLTEELDAKDSL